MPTKSKSKNRKSSTAVRRPPVNNSYKRQVVEAAQPDAKPILIAVAILAVIIGLVAILIIAPWNSSSVATTSGSDIPIGSDPSAKVDSFPNQGRDHLQPGQTYPGAYNSNPPTSGPHDPYAQYWGIYYTPQRDEQMLHNLEHGGIVMYYDCPQGCAEALKILGSYASRYPKDVFTGILVAPRKLPDGARIAVTAWQNRLLLKTLDTAQIDRFVAAFFNKGPESAG